MTKKYLPHGEREMLLDTLNAMKKKKGGKDKLGMEDVTQIIDAVHACGWFLVKRGSILRFSHYCEKVHRVLLTELGLEPMVLVENNDKED